MAFTWDPLNIHANMSLSNGDLTVDCDTADTNQCAISEWSWSGNQWLSSSNGGGPSYGTLN